MTRALSLVFGFALAFAAAVPALAASPQQQTIEKAERVVAHLRSGSDPTAARARDLIHRARAVLIVPELVKAGFIVGGQGGNGVLLARDPRGWSYPAFYNLGGGSVGLQIGATVSEVVLIIMSERALQMVREGEFKIGGTPGIGVATPDGRAAGSVTPAAGAPDIYVIAESKGLFGGITIEGGTTGPNEDWNSAYYGRYLPPSAILRGEARQPAADGLRRALGGL